METGVVIEYVAFCDKCKWHGHKFGNKANADAEASMHIANSKHDEVSVAESQIDNNWPEISEEEAKLLFIRKSAQEAYETNNIVEATKGILKTIVEVTLVSSMTKEQVGEHISRLEKARSFLAAFTQGIQIGYAKEAEPIFKARAEKRRQEKLAEKLGSSKDKKVNDLIALARTLAEGGPTETKKPEVAKQHCDKCGKDVFSLKYHSC